MKEDLQIYKEIDKLVFGVNDALDMANQRKDIGGGGAAAVQNKVGMPLGYLGLAHLKSL